MQQKSVMSLVLIVAVFCIGAIIAPPYTPGTGGNQDTSTNSESVPPDPSYPGTESRELPSDHVEPASDTSEAIVPHNTSAVTDTSTVKTIPTSQNNQESYGTPDQTSGNNREITTPPVIEERESEKSPISLYLVGGIAFFLLLIIGAVVFYLYHNAGHFKKPKSPSKDVIMSPGLDPSKLEMAKSYVANLRTQSIDDMTIKQQLKASGWPAEYIDRAVELVI